jgi:uncharacterized protein (TIRG00374 family)
MKGSYGKIIRVIMAVGLVVFLLLKVDWGEMWLKIQQARPGWLLAFTFFYFLGIMISARKWQVLARFLGFQYKYFFYYKNYLLGSFINNFLPSFVGGDTYRVYRLGSRTNDLKKSSLTVIADRLSGLVGIMILAGFFAILNYSALQQKIAVNLLLAIVWGGLLLGGITLVCFQSNFGQKFLKILPKAFGDYIKKFVRFKSGKILFSMFGYSFLFAFLGIAIPNFFLFKAFGVELSFFDFLSVAFLTNLVASLPISVGNIGIKEWAYVFFFGIFGVDLTVAVAVVMVARVIQMLVSLLALPFYFQSKTELIVNKKLNK